MANEQKRSVPESMLRRVGSPDRESGKSEDVKKTSGSDFLGDVLPMLGKFPAEEVGKVFLDLLRLFMVGGKPSIHAIIDIRERKLSICVYDGDIKGKSTTLIDM